jgi:Spy/CpxP family protein refolding chaperone
MTPARDLENGLLSTLADGVAAGTIDTAKVDAAIGQLDAAATTVHGCDADTLNQLHAVLSRAERMALVAKVQAHWDVWRQANSEAEAGGREKGSRLAELALELNLTSDQVEKMSAALQTGLAPLAGQFDSKKVDAHVKAFTTAFVHKSFDAKSITANANGRIATYGAKRMSLFYETLNPLLTPEQRTTLAQHLREHAGQSLASSAK